MNDRDATPRNTRVVDLLVTLFSLDELRLFVHRNYPKLRNDLPENLSPTACASHVADMLDRRGELDGDFFAALRRERPKRGTDIDALAADMSAHTPPLQTHRGPSLTLRWTPACQHPDTVADGVLRLPAPRVRSAAELQTTAFADDQAFHRWYCAEFWPLTLRWASLVVKNEGTSPATSIDVSIQVPPTLRIMRDLSALRAYLHPAKRILLALRDLVTPTEAATLRREHESLLKPKQHAKTMPPPVRMRVLPGDRIRITALRLMHTYTLPTCEPLAVMALPGAPTGPLKLPCELFCREYRQRASNELTVIVEEPPRPE